MKYKLLIVDLDDTLTSNLGMPAKEFNPSIYLQKTIKKLFKYRINISLCTGRDKKTALDVVTKLGLTTPQIIEGGSRIIDHKGKDLWARYIEKNSALTMIELLRKTESEFSIITDGVEYFNKIPDIDPKKVTGILWYDLDHQKLKQLKQKLLDHQVAIQINQDRIGNTVYVTHLKGTKAYGIKELLKILGVKKEETIGIGDGNNDKNLLLNCGFKVAMGNAVEEIKSIADYITSSVDDDGVADAIDKIIFNR